MISSSKRRLVFGRGHSSQPVRPPWAIDENNFIEVCDRCAECVRQCPRNIIHLADGGFPELNFSHAGCDFCKVCEAVCKTNAINANTFTALNLYAEINTECFSNRGVICRSCGEVCPGRAIRFQHVVGGLTQTIMNSDLCNGCGECVSICPAHAITIKHRH